MSNNQGDYILSSLSNVTLKSEETLVEVILLQKDDNEDSDDKKDEDWR